MEPETCRDVIRTKLVNGRLPTHGVPRVWGGVGHGERCDGCGKIMTVIDFVFGGVCEFDGKREIEMHVECFRIWDDERVAFKTAPDSMTLVDKVREKIAAGKLPTEVSSKRWAGHGNGVMCDACDDPISGLQYEFDSSDGRLFRFHRDCMIAWDELR